MTNEIILTRNKLIEMPNTPKIIFSSIAAPDKTKKAT